MVDVADRLMAAARERLRDFGIALERERQAPDAGIDAIITLSRGGHRQRYLAMAKESMTVGALAHEGPHHPSDPLLIIGDRISRRSAAAFRAGGIQFVDALGNAYITFDGVFVEVQGRTEAAGQVPDREQHHVQRQPSNIFSSRRSQVILALLAWSELSTATVREVAKAAGVSTGQAHDALTQLQRAGFLVPVSKRLDRAGQLLDLWTAAYPTGLGRRLEIAGYHGDPARPVSGLAADQVAYLSGESAGGGAVVRPATLTVYLDHLDPKLPVLNRWDANPERPPNIFVRHKFWTSPRADKEEPNAPWPLVYADLVATRDARLAEVAQAWRSQHARSD